MIIIAGQTIVVRGTQRIMMRYSFLTLIRHIWIRKRKKKRELKLKHTFRLVIKKIKVHVLLLFGTGLIKNYLAFPERSEGLPSSVGRSSLRAWGDVPFERREMFPPSVGRGSLRASGEASIRRVGMSHSSEWRGFNKASGYVPLERVATLCSGVQRPFARAKWISL